MPRLADLERSYRDLWKFYVFADTQDPALLAKICEQATPTDEQYSEFRIVYLAEHASRLEQEYDDTLTELRKFEERASEKYSCYQYQLISVNGAGSTFSHPDSRNQVSILFNGG